MDQTKKWTPFAVVRHADSLGLSWSRLLPQSNLQAPGQIRATDGYLTVLQVVAQSVFPRKHPYSDRTAAKKLGLSAEQIRAILVTQDGLPERDHALFRQMELLIVSCVPRGKMHRTAESGQKEVVQAPPLEAAAPVAVEPEEDDDE